MSGSWSRKTSIPLSAAEATKRRAKSASTGREPTRKRPRSASPSGVFVARLQRPDPLPRALDPALDRGVEARRRRRPRGTRSRRCRGSRPGRAGRRSASAPRAAPARAGGWSCRRASARPGPYRRPSRPEGVLRHWMERLACSSVPIAIAAEEVDMKFRISCVWQARSQSRWRWPRLPPHPSGSEQQGRHGGRRTRRPAHGGQRRPGDGGGRRLDHLARSPPTTTTPTPATNVWVDVTLPANVTLVSSYARPRQRLRDRRAEPAALQPRLAVQGRAVRHVTVVTHGHRHRRPRADRRSPATRPPIRCGQHTLTLHVDDAPARRRLPPVIGTATIAPSATAASASPQLRDPSARRSAAGGHDHRHVHGRAGSS